MTVKFNAIKFGSYKFCKYTNESITYGHLNQLHQRLSILSLSNLIVTDISVSIYSLIHTSPSGKLSCSQHVPVCLTVSIVCTIFYITFCLSIGYAMSALAEAQWHNAIQGYVINVTQLHCSEPVRAPLIPHKQLSCADRTLVEMHHRSCCWDTCLLLLRWAPLQIFRHHKKISLTAPEKYSPCSRVYCMSKGSLTAPQKYSPCPRVYVQGQTPMHQPVEDSFINVMIKKTRQQTKEENDMSQGL